MARCVRLENQPTVAGVGFAIMDSHQGRGWGIQSIRVLPPEAYLLDGRLLTL